MTKVRSRTQLQTEEFTVATTGNVDDLDFGNAASIRFTNATLTTLRGLKAGQAGQVVTIISAGAGQVNLSHQNAGSTATNRLINLATSAASPLAAGAGVASYVYDATTARWRMVSHDQGSWISQAYAAGNFTASGSMTWTVDSGDVGTFAYWLKGKTLSIQVNISASTLGGTAGLSPIITIPGGFSASVRATLGLIGLHLWSVDGGTTRAFGIILPSTSSLNLYQSPVVNWTLNTNLTEVNFVAAFEVD